MLHHSLPCFPPQKVLCFQELLPHPELGQVAARHSVEGQTMLQTFSPANHPCMPPLPSSTPNTATEPSLVGLGPQTPPCFLLPLARSPGLGTACSHRADNGQDVGAEPGGGGRGIAALLSGGGRGSPPSMLPFELRPGTGSNHCLLTRDQSSPELSCSSAAVHSQCPCTGWGLSRRSRVWPLLPEGL